MCKNFYMSVYATLFFNDCVKGSIPTIYLFNDKILSFYT
jgi:hypothetical protein